MELVSVRTNKSPFGRGRLRLVGDVIYDDRPGRMEQLWFDVPEEYADSLSVSGNPWLACLLPLAVTLREPLRLCVPIDPVLSTNAIRLMQIWTGWYRRLRIVPIEAEVKPTDAGPGAPQTAALFSGGVDSFFTLLRNREAHDRAASPSIDRLLCVWGFDIGLDSPEEYEKLRSRLSEAARENGTRLIDVATNLRDTRFRDAHWGRLAHGSALASIGLALERRFQAVYIAATYTGGTPIQPWGSHPETDPLLSTGLTRIIHDNPGVSRFEKTQYVSRSDAAMRSLHVCPPSRSSENCGDCRKCYLVMLTLEVLGALSRCSTLSARPLDLERVKRIYTKSASYDYLFLEIAAHARQIGREDIVDAIARCVKRSRRLKRLLLIPDWMKGMRGLWRVARVWRQAVLARSPK